MLYSLRGTLTALEPSLAVVECGGVGFACHVTMNTARRLPSIGQEVFLYTILNVREDAMDLFGFADQAELACFKQLTAISGVGPKVGISILSELTPERVALAVAAGDYKALTHTATRHVVQDAFDGLPLIGAAATAEALKNVVALHEAGEDTAEAETAFHNAVETETPLGLCVTYIRDHIAELMGEEPAPVLEESTDGE